jgi:hypothetical protein
MIIFLYPMSKYLKKMSLTFLPAKKKPPAICWGMFQTAVFDDTRGYPTHFIKSFSTSPLGNEI